MSRNDCRKFGFTIISVERSFVRQAPRLLNPIAGRIYRRLARILPWLCIVYVASSLWFFMFWIPAYNLNIISSEILGGRIIEFKQPSNSHANVSEVNKHAIVPKCDMKKQLNLNAQGCERIVGNGVAYHRNISSSKQTSDQKMKHTNTGKYDLQIGSYCDIKAVSSSCTEVRQSYLYGKDKLSAKEKALPLAFTIKLHANANQAHRLLRFIYRQHNIYCIHVDKKASGEIYDQFRNISKCLDNIVVIVDRVSVVYSTIRQVEAEFRCIDAMLKANVTWRYYINLTGQEFMLKTNAELVEILEMLRGRNDIESYPMTHDAHKYKQRTFVVGKRAQISKLPKQPFNRNIIIRKGSAYGLLSREFLEFVKTDSVAQEFIKWLEDTYAPEEMIWATLNALSNAPGGYQRHITQKNSMFLSRAVIWSLDKQYNCKGKFVRWVCIYGAGDLPWLLEHRNIVANKFHEDYQPLALDCLERSMYQRLGTRNGIGEYFNTTRYADITGQTHIAFNSFGANVANSTFENGAVPDQQPPLQGGV